MNDKHDLMALFLSAREQGIGALLAFFMAILRGRYNSSSFTKTLIDALMCAMIAWFVRDLLQFLGLNTDLGYITSVFIGYVGTESIGAFIKRVVNKRFMDDNSQSK
ncbi:MAG: hypothetical protein XXXJIFNMEKO3_01946 [Candidatus Erwinia impunctatus]|nr:hypothetical protein XXXJIFNMEKO_01946 [Culicoides impunctatus]